ncbi:MAG: hypothetical protein ACJ8LG_23065 [Massilia sp.]
MTQIDSTGRFLLQMSEQISAVARRDGIAARNENKGAPRKASRQNLEQLILERVLAVDPADPDGRRKAFRLFLESVLAHELGPDLLTDAAYNQVVEKVHQTMDKNEALSSAMDKAGEFLLDAARQKTGLGFAL